MADVFARTAASWKTRVAENVKANGVPPRDLLIGFTRDRVVAGISGALTGAPDALKDEVHAIFASHAWDVASGAPTDGFSLETLQAALDQLCARFPVRATRVGGASAGPHGTPAVAAAAPVPSADELADLALACAKVWELDDHRLTPGVHYVLNVQGGKRSFEEGDFAREPLFTKVNTEVWDVLFVRLMSRLSVSCACSCAVARNCSRMPLPSTCS